MNCGIVVSIGLAKLGNIGAETMFHVMFPGVAKLWNICFGRKICVREAENVFDSRQKHFLFSEKQNLFPQHMFPARLKWETFASATMFPSLARPYRFCVFLFQYEMKSLLKGKWKRKKSRIHCRKLR